MISQFLDRILTEHVESICSMKSNLSIDSICSVRNRSRNGNENIFKKPIQFSSSSDLREIVTFSIAPNNKF